LKALDVLDRARKQGLLGETTTAATTATTAVAPAATAAVTPVAATATVGESAKIAHPKWLGNLLLSKFYFLY
jgi:hypothetical protein